MVTKRPNPLKDKLKVFQRELVLARYVNDCAMKTLKEVDKNTNLTQKIGVLVKDLPEFNHCKEQMEEFKTVIRKVCTGELEPNAAYEFLADIDELLHEVILCISEGALYSGNEQVTAEQIKQQA